MVFIRSIRDFTLATCMLGALTISAQAQQRIQIGDLIQRIDRLETEVTRLRVAPSGGGSDVARLDQIEQELRRLTGIIERLEYDSRTRAASDAKRFEGVEERLRAVEGNRIAVAPPSSVPGTPMTQSDNFDRPGFDATVGTSPFQPSPQQGGFVQQDFGATQTAAVPTFPSPQPPQSAVALYNDGVRLLNIGSFDEAGARFEDLIAAYPQDPNAGQAQYWLGHMHFELGRFEQAAAAFLDSFRNWPEGAKAPDSLLKLGMTLANIGKTEEACLSFKQVSARYPSAPPSLLRRAQIEGQRYRCGS